MQESSTDTRIESIAKGDRRATEELFSELEKPIYLLAYSILRNHALAEDVVQETFLKVMGGAASYRPQGNERAWVLRIAHNTTIDITRRERQTSQLIDNSADDESGFQETDVGLDFLKATEHLSERDRSIVILKVFSMLSHAEIAKTVNMTEGAVRVRYRRILNRLRNFYEQKE